MCSSAIFAVDLDNTLIHSYKKAKPDDICVEVYNGKEISFISKKAYDLLKEVSCVLPVIPVTTRSLEQYRRINLGVDFACAVVANGVLMINDGVINKSWEAESRILFDIELPRLVEDENIHKIRYVEDAFIAARAKDVVQAVDSLKKNICPDLFNVYAVGSRVYVIPKNLDKSVAVMRLKKHFGVDFVISAGDSELDIGMLGVADIAYVPIGLVGAFQQSTIGFPIKSIRADDFAFEFLSCVRDFCFCAK